MQTNGNSIQEIYNQMNIDYYGPVIHIKDWQIRINDRNIYNFANNFYNKKF